MILLLLRLIQGPTLHQFQWTTANPLVQAHTELLVHTHLRLPPSVQPTVSKYFRRTEASLIFTDTSQAIQQGSQSLPLLVGQQGLQGMLFTYSVLLIILIYILDATTDLPFVSNRWHSNKFRWSRLWLAYTSPSLVIGIGFLVWGITGRENPFNSEKNISSSAMILAIGPILVVGAYWINCFFDREGFPAEHFARLNTLFFQSFAIIGLLVWFLVW